MLLGKKRNFSSFWSGYSILVAVICYITHCHISEDTYLLSLHCKPEVLNVKNWFIDQVSSLNCVGYVV